MPSLSLNIVCGQLLFWCWQLVIYLPSFELVVTFKLLSSSHPQQSSKSHISRAVLELCLAFSKYLSNLQNGMPLLKQLCDHILLNPAIWIHTPAKVMYIDLGLLMFENSDSCENFLIFFCIFILISKVLVGDHFWPSILFAFQENLQVNIYFSFVIEIWAMSLLSC